MFDGYRMVTSLICVIAAAITLAANCLGYRELGNLETRELVNHLPKAWDRLDGTKKGSLLQPILIPRVPGTENSTIVQKHFRRVLEKNGWRVEEDRFTSTTPIGEVQFTNLIGTLDPPGSEPGDFGRLVLAAHYDSKYTPEGFIGAMDSAVPCSLILYLVESLTQAIKMKWESDETVAVGGIQVIFFDGEEAYLEWTEEDSIYGARHLAEKMANTEYPTKRRDSELNAIDVLVLLDLIGMPNANSFVSFFNSTDWLHANLDSIQERLYRLQMCNNSNRIFPRKPFFEYGGLFLDDHIPFFKLGVPTLHLIPAQFPDQWHTMEDDYDHIDKHAVVDWAHILSVFVAEFFEVVPQVPKEKIDL